MCIIQCEKGHEWHAKVWRLLKKQNWCRACYGTAQFTLKDMQKFADKFDGKCLSLKYKTNRNSLEWRCSKGHEWSANFGAMQRRKYFCKICKK